MRRAIVAGRPRHVLGQRRLRRIRGVRLGPRATRCRKDMSFEQAATLPVALITLHNALITAGRLEAGRERDDPGRELGRRPDGPADRQAHGRRAGDRHVHQRRAPRAAQGVRRRSRDRHPRLRLAGRGAESDRRQGRQPRRRHGVGPGWRRHARRSRCSAAWSMSAASAAPRPSSTSTCMRSAASTISASPSAPARSRRCAKSTAACAPICGTR